MNASEAIQAVLDNGSLIQDPNNVEQYYLGCGPADVLRVAIDLAGNNFNQSTTSLDVKKALRAENLYAVQSEVSEILQGFADAGIFDVASTGAYNVYIVKA